LQGGRVIEDLGGNLLGESGGRSFQSFVSSLLPIVM